MRLLAINQTRRWIDSRIGGRWHCYSPTPWIGEAVFFFATLDDAVLFKLTFEGAAGHDDT